jgi:uncharacterized protein
MADRNLRAGLARRAEEVCLVDTHEHLIAEEQRANLKLDLSSWFPHYAASDLVSAGMALADLQRFRDTSVPLDERWSLFEPFWRYTRTTGYGRALLIAARDLFSIEDINSGTYQELSEKLSASNRPGWYEYVLKERAGIEVSLQDCITHIDPASELKGLALCDDRRLVAPVRWLGLFQRFRTRLEVEALEREVNANLHTLDDLLKAIDDDLSRKKADGAVALKMRIAYVRSLKFDRVPKADAERAWNRIFTHLGEGISVDEAKPLQDYVTHYLVQRSIDLDLPLQVHTGLQEGNANVLENSRPTLLNNLFLEYPRARFVIFHGGYPYCGELSALAKNFPNVYIDLCWLPIISPGAARRWLDEWLETVPHNKIFTFGGDYRFVEGAYAHSRIARQVVADVISGKVESGYITENEGYALVPALLRENAWRFYQLEDRWAKRQKSK